MNNTTSDSTSTATTSDAPWETGKKKQPKAKAPKAAKPAPAKQPTRPVHVPMDAVKAAEGEAKRMEQGIGETVAHLIHYAIARKAALAKYQKAAAKKPAKKSKAKK